MDPVTAITGIVAAGASVVGMYQVIKSSRQDSREKKVEALRKEKELHLESDRRLLKLIEDGKECGQVGNPKHFKKLMKAVFSRNPDQGALLGAKYQKCYEIAKRAWH